MLTHSKNSIAVTISCVGGTLLTVESQFGRHWGGLLVSLVPLGPSRCQAWPLYLTRQPWLLWPARFFFELFLRADLGVLTGMRPPAQPLLLEEDEVVGELIGYLRQERLWDV